jgi:hypothetical protein
MLLTSDVSSLSLSKRRVLAINIEKWADLASSEGSRESFIDKY